jgi:flagellar protein FliS
MAFPSRGSNAATYQSVAVHGGIAAADPHQLIVMLLDGALMRIAQARGAMERGATSEKSQHVNRAIAIIDELRLSLDLSRGEIAANLESLYDFMGRQLLLAHVGNKTELLDTVTSLLKEIRSAWILIPADARMARRDGK